MRITLMSTFVTESDRAAARDAGVSPAFEKPMELVGWRNQLPALIVTGVGHRRAT